MNRSRRDPKGLLVLALAFATAGGARAQEAAPAKVHGTITVDFDTVTISELLKLVSVVEKVDGTIHIVSSKPEDGQGPLLVSGAGGAIALTRADRPEAPRGVIGPAPPTPPPPTSAPPAIPPRPPLPPIPVRPTAARASSSGFPRLAALGRMLGIGRPHEHEHGHQHVHAPIPADPEAARVIPLETADAMPRPLAPGSSTLALDTGGFLGALAEGQSMTLGPIHSPWPKPGTEAKPKGDGEVSRAGGERAAVAAPVSRHLVAQGDTFQTLARKYYGDARYARALWWANRDRVAWPEALVEGKALEVPGVGELEPRMVLAGPMRSAIPDLEPSGPPRDSHAMPASFTEPAVATAAPDSGGVAVHVVRPDDTLRNIAREKCGDERKALEIMALNRDALARDGRPRVGQCLILPPPAEKP